MWGAITLGHEGKPSPPDMQRVTLFPGCCASAPMPFYSGQACLIPPARCSHTYHLQNGAGVERSEEGSKACNGSQGCSSRRCPIFCSRLVELGTLPPSECFVQRKAGLVVPQTQVVGSRSGPSLDRPTACCEPGFVSSLLVKRSTFFCHF